MDNQFKEDVIESVVEKIAGLGNMWSKLKYMVGMGEKPMTAEAIAAAEREFEAQAARAKMEGRLSEIEKAMGPDLSMHERISNAETQMQSIKKIEELRRMMADGNAFKETAAPAAEAVAKEPEIPAGVSKDQMMKYLRMAGNAAPAALAGGMAAGAGATMGSNLMRNMTSRRRDE